MRAHEQDRSEEVIAHLEMVRKKSAKKSFFVFATYPQDVNQTPLRKKKEGAKSAGGSRRVSSVITKLNAL